MIFIEEDNGNCRVYYREGKTLYCWQDEGSHGRHDFKFLRCSQDGEPSYEVRERLDVPRPPGETSIGRDLNDFLTNRGKFC